MYPIKGYVIKGIIIGMWKRLREIDKYTFIKIYLEPNNASFHIKYNCHCYKIQ
jgi:hypothetical protein